MKWNAGQVGTCGRLEQEVAEAGKDIVNVVEVKSKVLLEGGLCGLRLKTDTWARIVPSDK